MTETKPSVDRRQSALVLIVVALMVAVGGWIAVGLFGYRQLFVMTSHWKWRDTAGIGYWRGEILFAESRINMATGPVGPCRIMAFNPQTGLVRETGITVPGINVSFMADEQQFWFVSPGEVVWSDGTTVNRHRPKFALSQTSMPFLLDGQLTAAALDENGQHRLYSFVEGEWQAGRRIAIPGFGRTWAYDAERGEERLVPRTAKSAVKLVGSWEFVQACQVGGDVHVIATSYGNTSRYENAYRLGFDFVPDSTDVASALAPENSELDTTGWHRLDQKIFGLYPSPCIIDGDIALRDVWGQGRVWKPDPSKVGKFVSADQIQGLRSGHVRVAGSPSGDDVYFVVISRLQDVSFFHRVGGIFVPVPHSLPGNAASLVGWMGTVVGLALIVLALSHLILLGGASLLVERWQQPQYSFGHEVVTLAPLSRRFLARAIDLLIMLLPFGLVGMWLLAVTDNVQLAELSGFILNAVHELVWMRNWRRFTAQRPIEEFARLDHSQAATIGFLVAIAWAVGIFVLSVLIEGRTGAFVGKWLCGLRVVRTTLRPCSRKRILLRELLLCVDTANLLSPIPAVFAILSNEQRQRIGDLVADTIVVEHRVSEQPPNETSKSVT